MRMTNDSLSVLPVPAFNDNYLWLLHNGRHAAVVDPGDAKPIIEALNAYQLSLTAILITHHHGDHAGGISALAERYQVPVFGPRREPIPGVTVPLREGDAVDLPELEMRLSVLDVPGHTLGHIAYYADEPGWLFCGDTLFAGGCGRIFEGTPFQMLSSLEKLAALPPQTQVYCAHEYTISNLRFALEAEPENQELSERFQEEQAKRAQNLPTIPSTIALEKATNPFLRATEAQIADRLLAKEKISSREPITVFTALREWKNSFR